MSLKSLLKRLILEELISSPYDVDKTTPRPSIVSPNDPNLLDLTKSLDSGFCEYNPQINQYAQSSPETLAEMIIFVIATIQKNWYDVVPVFNLLMNYLRKGNSLVNPSDPEFYEKNIENSGFSSIILGEKLPSVNTIWNRRNEIYSRTKPYIDKYNKTSGIAKEEAMFEIYLSFLGLPNLGLPKAAFATQLVIGRLGCIDSVNMNLYKDVEGIKPLTSVDKDGKTTFKSMSSFKDKKILQITKGGVKLAKGYVDFLKMLSKTTKSGEAGISRFLWDSWVELIALKMNRSGDIDIIMPGGEKASVQNKYAKDTKTQSPQGQFRKKYIGNITGRDISRQHYPPMMTEGYKKWTKYFYKTLNN